MCDMLHSSTNGSLRTTAEVITSDTAQISLGMKSEKLYTFLVIPSKNIISLYLLLFSKETGITMHETKP